MAAEKKEVEGYWVKNISKGHRGFNYTNASGDAYIQALPRGTKVSLSKELYDEMAKNAPFVNQVKRGDFEISHPFN